MCPPPSDRDKIVAFFTRGVEEISNTQQVMRERCKDLPSTHPIREKFHQLDKELEILEREFVEKSELFSGFCSTAKIMREGYAAEVKKLKDLLRKTQTVVQSLRRELDGLATPPLTYGEFHSLEEDGSVNVILPGGRKMNVLLSPQIKPESLRRGQEVMLNKGLNVVRLAGFDDRGSVVVLKALLDNGRARVMTHLDEEAVGIITDSLKGETLRIGDHLLMDSYHHLLERLPKSEAEDLALEEVPDVSYSDIGGLKEQIGAIRDEVELPYLYPKYYRDYKQRPPKGVLLHGPPGCGKTLIAKAIVKSLAQQISERLGEGVKGYFLSVKGPEILNKYVGETERKIREIFQKAREKASEKAPVVIFFDEMDALFRMRGMGISSDVESTIVPQLLAEIDGLVSLEHVIVIGASNRQDLIDPAVFRPGRFDVKIKIERPDPSAMFDIFTKYLTTGLPLHGQYRIGKYQTPNRLQTLLPEQWQKVDNILSAIRREFAIKRRGIGKRTILFDTQAVESIKQEIAAKEAIGHPHALLMQQNLDKNLQNPTPCEFEEWAFDKEEDIVTYLIYRAVELISIKTVNGPISWFSRSGEFVAVETRFLDVTYADGNQEILYHLDFASGAVAESIVRRAKKLAIKRHIAEGPQGGGISMSDIFRAIREEFKENEDLSNTTNPDDWSRIVGRRGQRIAFVKKIGGEEYNLNSQRGIKRVGNTGQYL